MPLIGWYVLIEETVGGGDSQRWSLTTIRRFADRDEALWHAADFARTYQPRHPAMPRNRRVFKIGEDSWVVYIEGAMRTYHFRIFVAQSEE